MFPSGISISLTSGLINSGGFCTVVGSSSSSASGTPITVVASVEASESTEGSSAATVKFINK